MVRLVLVTLIVALRLVKYRMPEIPQIAKVVRKDGFDVTVEWWVGTYTSTFGQSGRKKKTSCKRNRSSQCNNIESTAHQE